MIRPPHLKLTFARAMRIAGHWARHHLEYLLVLTLEGLSRLVNLLDPRVYFESMRVRSVREGGDHKAGGKFFVLVLYCEDTLPAFTRTIIDAVARSPFNLVVVPNGRLAPALANQLLGQSRLLVERNNIGRDFGGYKDGVNIVLRRFDVDRLVIANDSVFYLPEGLDKLLADLDKANDFTGVSEVYLHHYHVASFMMSFGRRVIANAAFRQFWQRYKPLGTRRWAIFRGEGPLTAALLRAGFRPRVLYQAAHLREPLSREAEIVPLLPLDLRAWLAGEGERSPTTLLHKIAAALKWLHGVRQPPAALPAIVVDEIMGRNQMHAAGLMFRKVLGLPIVKRDLYFRGVFSLDDLAAAVADQPPALRDDIMADLRRRGHARELGPFGRLLQRHA
jgi:hypothetical protein